LKKDAAVGRSEVLSQFLLRNWGKGRKVWVSVSWCWIEIWVL